MSHRDPGRKQTHAWRWLAGGAAAAGFLIAQPRWVAAGPPERDQDQVSESPRESGPGEAPRGQASTAPRAEPRRNPVAERAHLGGGADPVDTGQPTASAAVARALDRVRRDPGPPDEVFAFIQVTDRVTGERRLHTRGRPDPRLGDYLADPRSAPAGVTYVDFDDFVADDAVEIATRSVRLLHASPFEGEPSRAERREQEQRDRIAAWRRSAGAAQAATAGLSDRISPGLRSMQARGEIDLLAASSSAPVPVMIALRDLPELRLPKAADPAAAGLLWVGLDVAAARERSIIERKRDIAVLQAPIVRAVESAGGTVEYASWMSGLVRTSLPPAAIRSLAEHPSVLSLEFIPKAEVHGEYFKGDDTFIAMNAEDFFDNHSGFNGVSSKHPQTSRVVVSMGEECIDTANPAWLTGAAGTANRARFYDCDPDDCTLGSLETCWDDPADGGNWPPHGHYVAGVMAGDLMDGQIASFSAAERRRISGSCPECRLYFFQDQGLNEQEKILEKACEKGTDIHEMSLGWTSGATCDGEGFMDDAVETLIDCDAAMVVSAGNKGSPDCELDCCDGAAYTTCTTLYPADHPWTLAVSGIHTEAPCDTPGEYYGSTCVFDECSSRGGGSYDGQSGKASIVDLAAPWRLGSGITPGTVSPGGGNVVGTSFGAPLVAGLMANVMDWYRIHISTAIFYNNRARNFMLLMGDRSGSRTGTNQNIITPDKYWGAGRVSLMAFDQQANLSVQRVQVTLGKNESYTFTQPLSSSMRFYKAVVWHDGKDYENEPRIDLKLEPQGCDEGFMTVNRLDSKSYAAYGGLDGCSGMRVTVKNTPVGSSGTRTFHFASYGVPQTNDRQF